VFTARYALSPYIKQTRFVFKGLNMYKAHVMHSSYAFRVQEKTSPIPVAARSKAWVCGRALAGIVGSNPTGGTDVCVL
jgi:hypothetical protein